METILHMYRLLYQNLMGNANQKLQETQAHKKKKQPKRNTKDGHQNIREQEKTTQNTENNAIGTYILIATLNVNELNAPPKR